jgi:hypothetical protein
MIDNIKEKILKSNLPIYLNIDDGNIFYNDYRNTLVIIRGSNFTNVESKYILDYYERHMNKQVFSCTIIDNKIELLINKV